MHGNILSGLIDMIIIKYSEDGERLWTLQNGWMGEPYRHMPFTIIIDNMDNIYIVGRLRH